MKKHARLELKWLEWTNIVVSGSHLGVTDPGVLSTTEGCHALAQSDSNPASFLLWSCSVSS